MSARQSAETLGPLEARDLTIALGASNMGDDFHNPEAFGVLRTFKSSNWKAIQYRNHPERYDAYIQEQIDNAQDIVAPHIGKIATGKTTNLVIQNEGQWEEWDLPAPLFPNGFIKGVEGHIAKVRKFVPLADGDKELIPNKTLPWVNYRIGVVLDPLTKTLEPTFPLLNAELPNASSVLVPIRTFPDSIENYSGLFSDQLQQ